MERYEKVDTAARNFKSGTIRTYIMSCRVIRKIRELKIPKKQMDFHISMCLCADLEDLEKCYYSQNFLEEVKKLKNKWSHG